MRAARGLVLLSLLAAACRERPLQPFVLAGGPALREAFETELTVTRFSLLPADSANPMAGRSAFAGRCTRPSTWVATFDIAGVLPQVGAVTGNASHCTVATPAEAGPETRYDDGRAWLRAASGDLLFLRYGNGIGRAPDAQGYSAWRDEWTITGGTGAFARATGTGTSSGTMHLATRALPPYRMRGRLDPGAAPRTGHRPFRGRVDGEWTLPYLVSGRMADDPCMRERGAGWVTETLSGNGVATHVGAFTLEGSGCRNLMTGAEVTMPIIATAVNGGTFQWVPLAVAWDFPTVVPGIDRDYSGLLHERLTGLTGRLSGLRGEFWATGTVAAQWRTDAGAAVPALPWRLHVELSGWYAPAVAPRG